MHGIFGDRDENHRFVFKIPPGHYSLTAILNTNYHWIADPENNLGQKQSIMNKVVDKGTVYSNVVEFDIVEPKGVEKKVHEKLLEAYSLTSQIKKGGNVRNQIYPILKSILDDNPVSVYSIAAHKLMRDINLHHMYHKSDLLEDLERFRNQIYSYRLIQDVNKNDNIQKIENIKQKYPNSRLAKYIDREF